MRSIQCWLLALGMVGMPALAETPRRAVTLKASRLKGPFPSAQAACARLGGSCRVGPPQLWGNRPFAEARLVTARKKAGVEAGLALRVGARWYLHELPGPSHDALAGPFTWHPLEGATVLAIRTITSTEGQWEEGGREIYTCEGNLQLCAVGPSTVPSCATLEVADNGGTCRYPGESWDWEAQLAFGEGKLLVDFPVRGSLPAERQAVSVTFP